LTVVAVFERRRWDESELTMQAAVFEPVDVLGGGELDMVELDNT
jgi:hypothetical protein